MKISDFAFKLTQLSIKAKLGLFQNEELISALEELAEEGRELATLHETQADKAIEESRRNAVKNTTLTTTKITR